jgi:hypothetical protein
VTSTTKITNPFNESYYLNTADLVNDDNKTNNMIGSKAAYKIHGFALLSVVYCYGDEIIETKLGWYF